MVHWVFDTFSTTCKVVRSSKDRKLQKRITSINGYSNILLKMRWQKPIKCTLASTVYNILKFSLGVKLHIIHNPDIYVVLISPFTLNKKRFFSENRSMSKKVHFLSRLKKVRYIFSNPILPNMHWLNTLLSKFLRRLYLH